MNNKTSVLIILALAVLMSSITPAFAAEPWSGYTGPTYEPAGVRNGVQLLKVTTPPTTAAVKYPVHWLPPARERCVFKQNKNADGTVFKTIVGYTYESPVFGTRCFVPKNGRDRTKDLIE